MSKVLTREKLTKVYGKAKTALDGIDLELDFGRIVGLLGPNGSGKTTLLKLANGLLQPTEGRIRIAGMAPGPETKELVSYLPDADWLPDWMRVEELVEMFRDFYGTPSEAKAYIGFDVAKANEMLARLNIAPNARLKTLSKGNKEKVQLVLAMSRNARLYLLDEPIGGVDPAARDYILNTIISNYSKDATVVISTHLIEDIEPVLDEAVFLKDGRIFAHRAVDDIRETEQLLKYEFKATKRLYFGLYLALALLSVVLGVTFRQEHALAHSTSFQNLEVILMIVYVSVILAIAVLCFVNTIQRFYQNLLGREGYLMHTLPVNENQLILSKLITSMVWVLCSGLVGIVCITEMVAIGVFDPETFGMVDWNSWKQLWGMLYGELGAKFWLVTFWTILINLARLASLILCVYAACMIAHQFPKHVMVAGILAFIGLNIVETQLDKLLGTNDVSMIVDVMYRVVDVNVTGVSYGVTPMRWLTAALGTDVGYLFCFAVTAAIAAAYFFLTRWLMKNKLNLE